MFVFECVSFVYVYVCLFCLCVFVFYVFKCVCVYVFNCVCVYVCLRLCVFLCLCVFFMFVRVSVSCVFVRVGTYVCVHFVTCASTRCVCVLCMQPWSACNAHSRVCLLCLSASLAPPR